MHSHLSTNLWKVTATELFVYCQLNREFISEKYYFYAAYTELYNISNKIYADVKHVLVQLQATAPQCPHCKLDTSSIFAPYIAYSLHWMDK